MSISFYLKQISKKTYDRNGEYKKKDLVSGQNVVVQFSGRIDKETS